MVIALGALRKDDVPTRPKALFVSRSKGKVFNRGSHQSIHIDWSAFQDKPKERHKHTFDQRLFECSNSVVLSDVHQLSSIQNSDESWILR